MTWLLYAVLVDLTDEVAEALGERFSRIPMEIVYRGLHHFTQAYYRGKPAIRCSIWQKRQGDHQGQTTKAIEGLDNVIRSLTCDQWT